MKKTRPGLLFALFFYLTPLWSTGPILTDKALSSPPPRIIRTCCSFGTEMRMMGIPGVKINDITSLEKLGPHQYLGNAKEGNGIIYTRRGGFIDLGHLRDQADWTAYLYSRMVKNDFQKEIVLPLGYEGGSKVLHLYLPEGLENNDAMSLAGKIAYDLSAWHEIATWFGTSMIPLLPERYSSFSIEDAYSNLLGVTIGIEALQSDLPYETAMTQLISEKLNELEALTSEVEIYDAMESVRNVWWTRDKALPSRKVLIQRQIQLYPTINPWLVPEFTPPSTEACVLEIPRYTISGLDLNDLYNIEIKLNYKFPFKRMFPDRKDRTITQNDFSTLLEEVENELTEDGFLFK